MIDLLSPTVILWSQSARHCRSGRPFSLAKGWQFNQTGRFAQGSTVTGSDGTFSRSSYTGGTGNDIVLTVVQVPASPSRPHVSGGALAIAGLAFTQRRRLKSLVAFSR